MRVFDERVGYVLRLLALQTACIAFGLWIHYRLVIFSLKGQLPVAATGVLRWAGAITLVWTCALLGGAIYIMIVPFFERLAQGRARNEAQTLRRMQSLVRMRDAVIFGLAKLTESRDDNTGKHLDRVCAYSSWLATALRSRPKYRQAITAEFIELIGVTAALHDIGKVGIEDAILLKPGRLTESERRRMQEHPAIGETCLLEIERRLGPCNFLQMARDIVLCHQERWDGSGYPAGLAGERIPLAARIVAIADVYDALSSQRVYKPALPHDECVAVIEQEAGTQFDPELVEVFLKIHQRFREIAGGFGTGDRHLSSKLPLAHPLAAGAEMFAASPGNP